MASSVPLPSTMKLFYVLPVLLLLASVVEPAVSSLRRYDSIFSFGDSFADTGNGNVVYAERSVPNPYAHPPYGQTFFGRPTGRSTNGRLIIDFVASELGLPFVHPSLSDNRHFKYGANFAVSGSTTLNVSFFKDIPIASQIVLNTTSSVQLEWFESLKPSLCSTTQACPPGFFNESLFFVGEFGFNDYSFALLGRTLTQVKSTVPDVVRAIAEATEGLIRQGATTLVVPGIPPLGCAPPNLELFSSTDPARYESHTGCLKEFNELTMHHNSLLQETLEKIRKDNPSAMVVYADFFTPIIKMVENPDEYGFIADVLSCCCGGGGRYNFNMSAGCGMPSATVCDAPNKYMFWDGHFTEATYRYIAGEWINDLSMHNNLMEATNRYFDIARDSA